MPLGPDNFLTRIQELVTGDEGFLVDDPSLLQSADSAAGETALGDSHFHVPRDYDEYSDLLKIEFSGRMSGSTDTPDFDVVVTLTREGETDETLQASTTVLSLDDEYATATLDLSGNELKRGDHLDIAVTIGAHATDDAERLSAVPTYRSTLVSYEARDDDNDLR